MNNQQNDDMDRQTLNVAFATQKGGSGIPELTREIATILKLEGYEEAAE